MTLHDELGRLADTAPRPTIDHSLWDQGRALRRRDRLVTSALVLAMVVILGGVAALVLSPQRTVDPADGPVPDGAIPSRIHDIPALDVETDFAIGRASVALWPGDGSVVVIGATDGRYHRLPISEPTGFFFALSPDGRRLAWGMPDQLHVADLETGDLLEFPHNGGQGAAVTSLFWQADSVRLSWQGITDEATQVVAGTVDLAGPTESLTPVERTLATGLGSPARTVAALPTDTNRANALFVRPARPGPGVDSDDEEQVRRALPVDLYPSGASVRPLGWAADDLVLAEVDAPAGSYVEGRHLALFTSPDRPESEWTYRIVVRDLPDANVSIATDLIPDLDGTSSQVLTHDFGEPEAPGDSPSRDRLPPILGGLAALVVGLAFIRMLRHQ